MVQNSFHDWFWRVASLSRTFPGTLPPGFRLGLAWLLLCLGLTACKTPRLSDMVIGPSYQPSNIYMAGPVLPESIRRVAVLPLAAAAGDSASEFGRQTLEPVLQLELGKARLFERVPVTSEQLRQWTGRGEWSAQEALPLDLLQRIRTATGCDAVLFCQLTQYRPYKPLAIGWNMKLVEVRQPRIWWSVDEVFDAGHPAVVNGARRYYQSQARQTGPLADSYAILDSPRLFAQYTLAELLQTLIPH